MLRRARQSGCRTRTGGSAGSEGPIVQIAAAFGSTLGQVLGVRVREMRTLVACGAAAGISATFNAPIAGALFAAEVIIGDFAVAPPELGGAFIPRAKGKARQGTSLQIVQYSRSSSQLGRIFSC